MVTPLYPSLRLPVVDPNWFSFDKAVDEDAELTALEKEHVNWLNEVSQKDSELVPPGQTDNFDDEEEEEDDNDDDDEESESNEDDDEEIEVDEMHFEADSPVINLI
ncbi:hypothetical protein HDE_10676 [Halotydeus destructor]|nr:hypothetical protein HDE_10676 [Halotydeus destructor]